MQESPFYELVIQRGIEQGDERGYKRGIEQGDERGYKRGIEQGARQTCIEMALATLKERFPDDDVDTLIPILEAIADINQLKQVNLNASLADSFLEFHKTLP